MTNDLYRHFDESGTLLYVGISLSALYRLSQHRNSGATWVDSIRTVKIEKFDSRESAVRAERNAIAKEAPLYNQARPKGSRARPVLESEIDLIKRIAEFELVYTVQEAAAALKMGPSLVRQYMAGGELGYIEVDWSKRFKPRRLITGWQLIDFIEHLQVKNAKK